MKLKKTLGILMMALILAGTFPAFRARFHAEFHDEGQGGEP